MEDSGRGLPKSTTLSDETAQRVAEHERHRAERERQEHILIGCMKRLFHTEDGKKVLSHLDDRFRRGAMAVPGDEVSTLVRVGERNVVEYIMLALERRYEDG